MYKYFFIVIVLLLSCTGKKDESKILGNANFSKIETPITNDSLSLIEKINENMIIIESLTWRVREEKIEIEINKDSKDINLFLRKYDKIVDSCYNKIDLIKNENKRLQIILDSI